MVKKLFLALIATFLMMAIATPLACEATFEVIFLDVTPSQVTVGETVRVTGQVKNIRGFEGTYTAVLTVDGAEVDRKDIPMEGWVTEMVTFSLSKDTPGIYKIGIGGLSSNLLVKEKPHGPIRPKLSKLNPQLASELDELPQIRDGISEEDLEALDDIYYLYADTDNSEVKEAFDLMIKNGNRYRDKNAEIAKSQQIAKNIMIDGKKMIGKI